eukprot:TRINITY_DN690_c0_g1_i3.p1 TRINITY_DN690_c0_g1~~TRINITY_DN690_c0_g1_i3.p1  ORF type:complete len:435 (-),score=113.75 TRINITY_DN690_c0_g1_i3:76-1380(-)
MALQQLKLKQTEWAESLLAPDCAFCDVSVEVGGRRIAAVSALLAAASAPFARMLFGSFREGAETAGKREVRLCQGTAAAFECLLRCCYGLDPLPLARADSVCDGALLAETFQLADMYDVAPLADECLTHVVADNVLAVYARMLELYGDARVPAEVEQRIWALIASEPVAVIESAALLDCPVEIVRMLVGCPVLAVNEEQLWLRCVQWARARTQACGCDGNADEVNKRLSGLLPHFRFPLMGVEFFADHVAPHIPPEKTVEVLTFHLLGRPTSFPREWRDRPTVVAASVDLPNASKLACGDQNAQWAVRGTDSAPQSVVFDFQVPTTLDGAAVEVVQKSWGLVHLELQRCSGELEASCNADAAEWESVNKWDADSSTALGEHYTAFSAAATKSRWWRLLVRSDAGQDSWGAPPSLTHMRFSVTDKELSVPACLAN